MKKRVIALMLCISTVMSFTACGKTIKDDMGTETGTESAAIQTYTGERSGQMDIDPEKQVTKLCDYDGIDITLTGDYEVSDEKIQQQALTILQSYGVTNREVTDRDTVEEGDYVNVDYTGYLDGEAFDGGAAEGTLIDVSNNKDANQGTGYIDGFSAGLIGAKVGSTVSSNVTFPENYQATNLAGKEVTFEFVVNGIYEPIGIDDVTDEQIAEKFSADYSLNTKEDFMKYVSDYMNYSAEKNKYSETVDKVKTYMLENCEVEIPEDYLAARVSEYQASFVSDYLDETEDLETYLKDNYNTTLADVQKEWNSFLTEQIKMEFIFETIAKKQNIELDEDNFKSYINSYVENQNYGMKDENAVYEYFGNGYADEGKAYMKNLYLVNQAIEYVVDNANVSNTADETETVDEVSETTEELEEIQTIEEIEETETTQE